MYPVMDGSTKYNHTEKMRRPKTAAPTEAANGEDITDAIVESLEYIYVDDPKDGNDSSAEEEQTHQGNHGNARRPRMAHSAGPALSYLRAKSRALKKSEQSLSEVKSSDAEDSDFSLPWDLLPSNIKADLEFYKNAGKHFEHYMLCVEDCM